MKTKELISLEDRFGAKNYDPLDVILSRGEGIWVWDVEGKYAQKITWYSYWMKFKQVLEEQASY